MFKRSRRDRRSGESLLIFLETHENPLVNVRQYGHVAEWKHTGDGMWSGNASEIIYAGGKNPGKELCVFELRKFCSCRKKK